MECQWKGGRVTRLPLNITAIDDRVPRARTLHGDDRVIGERGERRISFDGKSAM